LPASSGAELATKNVDMLVVRQGKIINSVPMSYIEFIIIGINISFEYADFNGAVHFV